MSITRRGQLAVPDPSEIVSADDVQRLIAEADRELAGLEQEAATALAAAEALERDVGQLGADEDSSGWALLHLRRYLESLQVETERHTAALIDIAERRARESVAMANAEVERGRFGGLPEETPPPAHVAEPTADPTAQPVRAEEVATPAPVVPAPAPEPGPAAGEPPAARAAAAATASVAPVPVVDVAPGASSLPVPETTTELRIVSPAPPDATATSLADPMAPEPATPPSAADGAPENETDFWQAPEPAPRKRRFRHIPWSAVFQVTAVIALLVVILLRLS